MDCEDLTWDLISLKIVCIHIILEGQDIGCLRRAIVFFSNLKNTINILNKKSITTGMVE